LYDPAHSELGFVQPLAFSLRRFSGCISGAERSLTVSQSDCMRHNFHVGIAGLDFIANVCIISTKSATAGARFTPAINGTWMMPRLLACAVTALLSLGVATAQAQTLEKQTLEKKTYNYSEWAKGRFSEVVTVTGPGKMIFLAGVGAENENGQAGDILYKGDVVAQCKYAFDKIKKALEKNGAGLGDAVKITTYLTDIRTSADFGKCRQEAFGNIPMPAHTLVNVSQLAWPGMLIEIDVTAIAPLK
jgi:2-iminobutanoate/2-iminopropanoate deaminase